MKTFIIALISAVAAYSYSNDYRASTNLSTWAEQKCSFAISMRDSGSRLISSPQRVLCLIDAVNAAGTNEESSGCIATLLDSSEPAFRPPIPTALLNSANDVITQGRCTAATAIELLFSRLIDRAGGLPLLEAFKYTSAAHHNRDTRIIVDKIEATNVVVRIAAPFGTVLSYESVPD